MKTYKDDETGAVLTCYHISDDKTMHILSLENVRDDDLVKAGDWAQQQALDYRVNSNIKRLIWLLVLWILMAANVLLAAYTITLYMLE
jgi:hypothetical protein